MAGLLIAGLLACKAAVCRACNVTPNCMRLLQCFPLECVDRMWAVWPGHGLREGLAPAYTSVHVCAMYINSLC